MVSGADSAALSRRCSQTYALSLDFVVPEGPFQKTLRQPVTPHFELGSLDSLA